MEFEKITRQRIKVVEAVRKPFMKYGFFRKTRENLGLHCNKTCFKCGRKFKDEDDAFLIITNKGNKIICESCNTECCAESE